MPAMISGKDINVSLGVGLPTVIIGERINPTGRKLLAEQLVRRNLDKVGDDARKQKQAGAHVIDVNVAAPGVDEEALLPEAVELVSKETGLPICIDSASKSALEAALSSYPHKALVNSVTGEEKSLKSILHLVKQYNAAVVGLTMDDEGIPTTAKRRWQIAERIADRAAMLGIPREDVIIDPLALAVAAMPAAAVETLDALGVITRKLGLATTLGASNISFGMPARVIINQAFLAMAVRAGLCAAIVNPLEEGIVYTILSSNLLVGTDDFGRDFLAHYRSRMNS